ncbi:class I SAM-dependent methyltransferase [Halalkalicoccus subterraneus]|uniref:class I SAM-dependent methyltransferase n=1 Tax=Halalkalicoccus subterraneus TaxID=2675002 RepID=UPI000EFAAE0C|nr:class I SAM-dependent methyltransferase family protein [Halalkalicoccus subterraneus]
MEVPCVRVPREEGEATRRDLAEADLIADDREIRVKDGWLYIPVVDSEAVPAGLAVVSREVPVRETQTTPADLLGFDPSYERIGDVALLDEDDPERADRIARAIVESDLPVGTVLNKASKVKGETRVRDWELLAGEGTETVHREYGFEYALDLATVYFSPRLATERHRVTEQIVDDENERVFDMFAGVGPFVIPAAARGAKAVGVDVNGRAIEYLHENAGRNGVTDRVTAIHGDVREVATEFEGRADRIVMNLPHSADEFLATAVSVAGEECTIHYYDIQHDQDPFGPSEKAIRDAASEAGYDVEILTRHVVRSYAPHELNVCLDVRLSRA